MADEYDSYLLQAAGRLLNGSSEEACAHYLVDIESEHIGLGMRDDTKFRALRTVKAIQNYLAGMREPST